jgi:hypothetical protein
MFSVWKNETAKLDLLQLANAFQQSIQFSSVGLQYRTILYYWYLIRTTLMPYLATNCRLNVHTGYGMWGL